MTTPATVKVYQDFVRRNALGGQNTLLKRAFYMMIEAGEFCNDVKKHVEYDGNDMPEERHKHMVEELGDTLYYFFLCMDTLGVDLQEVMEANIVKLEKRYAERQRKLGLDPAASLRGYSPVPDMPTSN